MDVDLMMRLPWLAKAFHFSPLFEIFNCNLGSPLLNRYSHSFKKRDENAAIRASLNLLKWRFTWFQKKT